MTETLSWGKLASPIGELLVVGTGKKLCAIRFENERKERHPEAGWKEDPSALAEPLRQLRAYFAGELREFDLDLEPGGTEFQRTVWKAIEKIPFGKTISYGELADRIGKPLASRAVGLANGRNPIPIVVPCHRVIGANGSLTGYGGGLPLKQKLLELEGIVLPLR